MRTVTIEKEVFNFSELSEKAKNRVREWYTETRESEDFTEMCEEYLHDIFRNSELHVEYDLGYCQGDYFNIYGSVCLFDFLEKFKNEFTEKEYKFLKFAFNEFCSDIDIKSNNRYHYNTCKTMEYTNDIQFGMECNHFRNINCNAFTKFDDIVCNEFSNLCNVFMKDGYVFFYEISDDDLNEWCSANEYEFTAEGELY